MNTLSHAIHMIDAYLMQRKYGTLIVDDGQVYLKTKDELITLNENYEIELIVEWAGRKIIPITFEEAVNTMDNDGWSLFGGQQARVKPK